MSFNNRFCSLVLSLIVAISTAHVFADSPLRTEASKGTDPHIEFKVEQAKKHILAEGPKFELVGILEKGNKSSFAVNGEDFSVSPDTRIDGSLRTGANVLVVGKIVSGLKYAKHITVTEDVVAMGSSGNSDGEFER